MNTAEFTEKYYIDRQGSHSRKWDGEHLKFSCTDLLPLWVADMGLYATSMHSRGHLQLCQSQSIRLYHDKSELYRGRYQLV